MNHDEDIGDSPPERDHDEGSPTRDLDLDAPQFSSIEFEAPRFEGPRFTLPPMPGDHAPVAGEGTGGGASASEGRLVRASAVVAVGTALSRVTGFARIAAIAYALGVTTLAGTYSYANEAPNIVYELLVGGVLTATLVPIFVSQLQKRDDEATSAVCTVAMLALFALTVVGVLAAPWIVRLYTIGAPANGLGQQQELATDLLRLFMPQMFFYGIVTLATALLNAHRRFAAAAFAPLLNNLVVIAVFLTLARVTSGNLTVSEVLDDTSLLLLIGLGTTAGIVVMALALAPALVRAGVRLRFLPRFGHPAVRTMLGLSGWTVGYVIENQLALLVVTILANGTDGGPFIYVMAYAFFQLPHGLFAVSLMTTFAPELARAAARGDLDAMRAQLARGMRLTAVIVVPAAALYLGLARPLVVVLLQRGAFSSADAAEVADTLAAFAVGLLPFSLYLFALRAFTSRLDTFTPFWCNAVENGVNIVLAFPLYAWLGIPGLALAFALSYFVGAGLVLGVLHRRLGGIDGRHLTDTLVRVVVAGVVALIVSGAIGRLVGWDTTTEACAALVGGGIAGIGAYLVLLRVLGVAELGTVLALVGRRAART